LKAKLSYYIHTIRHLRPIQIFWRFWRKLPVFPAPEAAPAPALRHIDKPLAAFPCKRSSLIGPESFREKAGCRKKWQKQSFCKINASY